MSIRFIIIDIIVLAIMLLVDKYVKKYFMKHRIMIFSIVQTLVLIILVIYRDSLIYQQPVSEKFIDVHNYITMYTLITRIGLTIDDIRQYIEEIKFKKMIK